MKQLRKAVIPAAGMGTRLRPATKSQPKEMLPVGRKPTIQYIVEEICAIGIQQVLIITSEQKRAIEDHFDSDIGHLDWGPIPKNRLVRRNLWVSMLSCFILGRAIQRG